jgi:uncharacterized membrane-anchored protein YjiN (DUF445 family)
MEAVAAGASKQNSSLQHRIRKLVTTWNASLSGEANTRQALDLHMLQLKHDAQPNHQNIVK